MKVRMLIAVLALTLGFASVEAAAGMRWLHIRVDEKTGDESKVRINVPVRLVSSLLPTIEVEEFKDGKIQVNGEDLDRRDIEAIVFAARNAEEGKTVTVETEHEVLSVTRKRGILYVNTVETTWDRNRVRIRAPMRVAEALLNGKEDEIDVLAALEELGKHDNSEILVQDQDDATTVRIWVDQSNG